MIDIHSTYALFSSGVKSLWTRQWHLATTMMRGTSALRKGKGTLPTAAKILLLRKGKGTYCELALLVNICIGSQCLRKGHTLPSWIVQLLMY